MFPQRTSGPRAFLVVARDVAERFKRQTAALAKRVQGLAAHTHVLRASNEGSRELLLDELETRDAELALAHTELQEMTEAFGDALALLDRETARRTSLFHAHPDALFLTDRRGTIEEANAAAAKLLAMPAARLPGKLLIGFVARRDTKAFRDRVHDLGHTPAARPLEVHVRPRGGAPPFPAAFSAQDVLDGGGHPVGLLWTMRPAHAQPRTPRSDELRERVLLAVRTLKASVAAMKAWTQVLGEGVDAAGAHAATIHALAQAAEDQSKPLEEIERIAHEAGEAHGAMDTLQ